MSINVDNNVKNQQTTPALYSDVYANIPAFGQTGRLFFATDTNTIYRDTGSAWVVFIAEFTGAGYVTIGTTQTITGAKTFTGGATFNTVGLTFNSSTQFNNFTSVFNQAVQLKNNTGFTITSGYMSIEAQDNCKTLHLYNGTSLLDYYLQFGTAATNVTFPTGTYTVGTGNGTVTGTGTINNIAKFSAAGNIADSSITDSGTVVATTSSVRIGTTPGTTYKLEVDGGINIATGHEYRKVGVSIFNTTNNNIPKFSTTTNTYTNSNILDTGTIISFNSTTLVNTTTDNTTGAALQVNGNISFVNVFSRKVASYTLVLADQNDIIEMNVATANNLTVPLNSTVAFPIGTEIAITQYGAGKTTIVATSGVTLRSAGGLLSIGAQYAMVTLVKVGTNEWYVVGNLIA